MALTPSRSRCSLGTVLIRYALLCSSLIGCLVANGAHDTSTLRIGMDKFRPPQDDFYACTPVTITKEEFVVGFNTQSDSSVAHHILLFGCGSPRSTEKEWNCGGLGVCQTDERILYAWGRNAPPTDLPDDVGFHVGGDSGVNYIVMQVHYLSAIPDSAPADSSGIDLQITTQVPTHLAGIYLLAGFDPVPAGLAKAHVDAACTYQGAAPIHPFAFRTHAHALARVITGYSHRDSGKGSGVSEEWTELARGNPQWPQSFYPMNKSVTIRPGDHVVARCTYDTTSRTKMVPMGMTHNDEMCNLYLMYYTESSGNGRPFYECAGARLPKLIQSLPAGSDDPPPRNRALEAAGMHHSHSGSKATPSVTTHAEAAPPSTATPSGGGDGLPPGIPPAKGHEPPAHSGNPTVQVLKVRMPGFRPSKEDYYVCATMGIHADAYLIQFNMVANQTAAHYMTLYGCEVPEQQSTYKPWQCSSPCHKGEKLLYAWERNSPSVHLPEDTGFRVGGTTGINYLVLQIHYKRPIQADEPADHSGIDVSITPVPPKYTAGILLMDSLSQVIPPHKHKFDLHLSCPLPGTLPIVVFASRAHAHSLGKEVSSYKYSGTEWTQLSRGGSSGPQPFRPLTPPASINPGDSLVATCRYDSSERDSATHMGGRVTEEMCNVFLMYYTSTQMLAQTTEQTFTECVDDQLPSLSISVPTPHEGASPSVTAAPPAISSTRLVVDSTFHPEVHNIPHFGQPSAVDTDSEGNVYVFHRANAVWTANSFDIHNNFLERSKGPIPYSTVTVFNKTGHVVESWGKNMFYMPHGITVDFEGNVWLTDVALHQVFKFKRGGSRTTPVLTLGVQFEHGADEKHFCKPTDVAVLQNGDFYVTDGYCNSRVMQFTEDGTLVKHWGTLSTTKGVDNFPPPGTFLVPHSIAVAEDAGVLCVADRENQRVQCFDVDGNFLYQLKNRKLHFVYGLAFSSDGEVLYMATRTDPFDITGALLAFSFRTRSLVDLGDVKLPHGPHEVCTDKEGGVYVAEMEPSRVVRFRHPAITTSTSQPTSASTTTAPTILPPQAKKVPPEPLPQTAHAPATAPSLSGSSPLPHPAATPPKPVANRGGAEPNEGVTATGPLSEVKKSQLIPIAVGVGLLAVLLISVGGFIASRVCAKSGHHSLNRKRTFHIGNIFKTKPKGFDPVSTEDYNFDSDDDEEYYTPPPQQPAGETAQS